MILVCGTIFFGLRSASARAWPWSDFGNVEQSQPWVTPLVLIGVLFATLSALRDFTTEAKTEAFFRSLFPVQTQFEFRDARTGERLKSVAYSGDGLTTTSSRRDLFAPRTSFSFSKGSDGMTAELTGFSGKPFNVTFTAEGYRPVTYTLNDKSPREVTLDFQAQ